MKILVTKIAKENNGLTIAEAVIFCSQNGYHITRQGLSQIGKKYGFVTIINRHDIVDKNKLEKFVEKVTRPIPKGWVKLHTMCFLAKSASHFYRTINKSTIAIDRYTQRQDRYAREKDLRSLFAENRKSDIEQKENVTEK